MNFKFKDREYSLNKKNLDAFFNDEENPINNIDEEFILNLLEGKELDFEKAYYSFPCEYCKDETKKKPFPFLEYHFYLYTKDNNYVTNSLKVEEEENSFDALEKMGKVDNSYIVSIIVCINCGKYSIEIEEFEI